MPTSEATDILTRSEGAQRLSAWGSAPVEQGFIYLIQGEVRTPIPRTASPRGRAVAVRRAHIPEVAGSIPARAIDPARPRPGITSDLNDMTW